MLVASTLKSRLPFVSGSSANTASSARSSSLEASIGPTSGTGRSGSSRSSSSEPESSVHTGAGSSGTGASGSKGSIIASKASSSIPGRARSDDAPSLSLDPKHWFMK